MKNQNGMTIIAVIFCILAMIGIGFFTVRLFININKERLISNLTTDMQLLQAKVKVIAQENIIKKDENPLLGKKVNENLEDEKIKRLIDNGVLNTEEKNFDKYYIIDNANLGELDLYPNIEDEYYLVNYSSYEIVYTKGIKAGENVLYKLSDLLKYRDEKEKNNNSHETVNGEVQTNEIQTNKEA